MKNSSETTINNELSKNYQYGFESEILEDTIPIGLNTNTIHEISKRKKEPEFLLSYRLKAFEHFLTMTPPSWSQLNFKPIDLQSISYFSAPKSLKDAPKSLDEVDPKILEIYQRLGVPLYEQKVLSGVAVDAIFDSVSVATTFKKELSKLGIIFCSFSEAAREHSALVEEYLGRVVPYKDNYYAALNAAVFSDGSFCYIPKGVKCPMDLSTYFRINAANVGQFERTLIIAEEGSEVSYLEGCTAPMRDESQLHAAVVEIFAHQDAKVRYSTVQNWYPGDEKGQGGIHNLVTKRGLCYGARSQISWTQVETGSSVTWKYPSVVLMGDDSVGEFYSVALTRGKMQADTGSKMIHLGKNTKSTIIAKGIAADGSRNIYRGMVKVGKDAENARNYSACDSLLMNKGCQVDTYPHLDINHSSTHLEHEASNTKVSETQLRYLQSRGLSEKEAISMIVSGFCKEVFDKLPMEFAAEVGALLEINLEGAVG